MFEAGHRILFTRYTLTSAHISIIPEFQHKIEEAGWGDYFEINSQEIRMPGNGNEIIFKGIKTSSGNQTANLKSLQGITTWVLDEAEELIDESTFDKIDLSIRTSNIQNRIILILNPTTKEHWIYKRFFEGKWSPGDNGVMGEVTYIHTSYIDNKKHLSPSFLNQVEEVRIKNPDKYRHIIMGGWLDKAEGVIFSNWSRGEFDLSLPCYYGLDFGFSVDPTALVRVAISGKKIYVQLCVYETNLTSNRIIEKVRQNVKGKELIIADSSEPRLIQELIDSGFNVQPSVKGADSIRSGIILLQSYEIIVCDSPEIEVELNNYVWSDRKSNTPIDLYNHAIDAIRYIVGQLKILNSKPSASAYGKGKPKQSIRDFYKDVL